jgi:hypothetical protein
VRSPGEGVRPHGLGDPRRVALEDPCSRLRRHVARAEPGAPGRQHERARPGQVAKSRSNFLAVVWNRPAVDLPTVPDESLGEQVPARVLAIPRGDAVGDGEHGRSHPFVFSRSLTSSIVISRSTAFAMS